ncbi:MAG TPA: tripartite tricarboxylate transporter TctB family protein [Candidatus Methylomirabilis sp.]|nr:tripartite tricarboxylate transporter TctB family protein [Candidatus Methylomirabilis sp.]
MQKAERIVAALCLLLGLGILWQAWGMEYLTSIGPGPGFFPRWLGLMLTGLSAAWLLSAVWRSGQKEDRRFFPEWQGLRRILLVVGAIIAVGVAMEFVGFQLAMFAFVVFVLTALGWRGWGLTVVLSAVMSFGVYHAFTRWLDVTLPQASIELLRRWGF